MAEYDPTDIQAHERARLDKAARERVARDEAAGDLRWLLSSKRGRRIAWRLLSDAGVFRLSFSTNAMQMAFNEGNRNFGNGMLTAIHRVAPDLYPVMLAENAPKEPTE